MTVWQDGEALSVLLMLWDAASSVISVFSCFGRCSSTLFPDTEVFEDDIQDLFWIDPSGDPAQAAERQAHALGRQSQVCVAVSMVLSQGRHAVLQVDPVAGLGQGGGTGQGVAAPTEEVEAQSQSANKTQALWNFMFSVLWAGVQWWRSVR